MVRLFLVHMNLPRVQQFEGNCWRFFWLTHTSARSRGTSKHWTRRAPARTGLTGQRHRSDRCTQRHGENLRSPPQEGPRRRWCAYGCSEVGKATQNVADRRRDKQGKHEVVKARVWETKVVKSNDRLDDATSNGRDPLYLKGVEVLPRKESFYKSKFARTPQFYSDLGSTSQTGQAHRSDWCGRCRIGYKTPHRSDRWGTPVWPVASAWLALCQIWVRTYASLFFSKACCLKK
jgi:hypothetical protein